MPSGYLMQKERLPFMIEKLILQNGIRVVHEHLSHVRSCAIGVWVQSGGRHEPEQLCGISHFIEHMMFKGTEKYTAAALAEEFDTIGGQVNAFTTKENTCYYARTLDTHLQKAASLLADMYFNSAFKEEDTDLERGVILEEIGMYEDTPEDLANELLFAEVFKGQSLGRPILGTKESLAGISGQSLKDYRAKCYTPENTLISICGSYTEEDLVAVCRMFDGMAKCPVPKIGEAKYGPAVSLKSKDIEQNHLIIGFPGLEIGSEKRYALNVMNNILGGGMSSRLFQTVREKHGLCYTIYSFSSLYTGAGVFGVYVALGKETEMQALNLMKSELLRFKNSGVTDAELSRAKEQLKSSVLMGMESTTSRMSSIARSELNYGRYISEEEIVRKLDMVGHDDIAKLCGEIIDFERMSFSAVGNLRKENEYMDAIRG